jgi:hypothetical protein
MRADLVRAKLALVAAGSPLVVASGAAPAGEVIDLRTGDEGTRFVAGRGTEGPVG